MRPIWAALLAVLLAQPAWAQTPTAPVETMSEQDLAVLLVRKLPFENDPSLNLRDRMDLVLALLGQISSFRLHLKNPSQKVQGEMGGSSENSEAIENGASGTTLVYHVPVTASGDYRMGGTRKGKSQYWTMQGDSTHFILGSMSWIRVMIEGRLRKPGIKALTISLPPGGALGSLEVQSSGGRSLLPPSGLKGLNPVTYRTMFELIARILGKLHRLPPKGGEVAQAIQPESRGDALKIAPLQFIFRLLKSGVFRFKLPGAVNLGLARLNGGELKNSVPGAPAPEGESDHEMVLALPAGEYQLEVPVGGAGMPALSLETLDEDGPHYATILKDLGFEASQLDQPMSVPEIENSVNRVVEILEAGQKSGERLELYAEETLARKRERVTDEWEWQNPGGRQPLEWELNPPAERPPISPVLPTGAP